MPSRRLHVCIYVVCGTTGNKGVNVECLLLCRGNSKKKTEHLLFSRRKKHKTFDTPCILQVVNAPSPRG